MLLDATRMASAVDPEALVFALEMQNVASPAGAFEETTLERWSRPVSACSIIGKEGGQ